MRRFDWIGLATMAAFMVSREATVMSFVDVIALLTVVFGAMVLLTPLLRQPISAGAAAAH